MPDFVADTYRLATAARELLGARSILDPVRFPRLLTGLEVDALHGPIWVQARLDSRLPFSTWGLTMIVPGCKRAWIMLNTEAWAELRHRHGESARTRWTCAHELGHAILHAEALDSLEVKADSDHDRELERQANRFAGELLMPRPALQRLSEQLGKVEQAVVAQRFAVSESAARHRIDDWNLLE